jgi:hypothetical protein
MTTWIAQGGSSPTQTVSVYGIRNHHQKEFHVIALTQVLLQIGLSTLIEGEI